LGREQTFSSLTRKILQLAYYQNYYTDSNNFVQIDKDHPVLFVDGPNTRKMANGGHLKNQKSPYLSNSRTDWPPTLHNDAY